MAWGKDPCTQQILETMRAARMARRLQSDEAVKLENMLTAATTDAEAMAVDELVSAIEKLIGEDLH